MKDSIAYGAGPVHEEFKALQVDLNAFADVIGFEALKPDGFIGDRTADAVKWVYDAVVKKTVIVYVTGSPAPTRSLS